MKPRVSIDQTFVSIRFEEIYLVEQTLKLDIFTYSSFSHFLLDWHNQKLMTDKNWSLGRFSQHSGLSNTAGITNIIRGRKIPSKQTLDKISTVVGLNQREKMYFESMVELTRNEGNSLLETSLKRLMGFVKPKVSQTELSKKTFSFISNPLSFAIREMVKLSDFQFDVSYIKNKLVIEHSEAEIKNAIETLLKVGLLNYEAGKLTQSVDFYETTTDIPSEEIRMFHKKCMDQSSRIIDQVETKSRHFTSDTIVLNQKEIGKIKEVIESFRKEVTTQYDLSEGEVVYQFNTQLIPVTKI